MQKGIWQNVAVVLFCSRPLLHCTMWIVKELPCCIAVYEGPQAGTQPTAANIVLVFVGSVTAHPIAQLCRVTRHAAEQQVYTAGSYLQTHQYISSNLGWHY